MSGLARWVLSLAAAACAAVLSTTATFTSGVRALMAEVGLVSNDGWIMGGTGNPIPDTDYVNSVESLYLSQYLPDTTSLRGGDPGAVLSGRLHLPASLT